MLSKKQPQTDKVNTVIGVGTVIEGKITSESSIRIDGTFIGEIKTKGNVIIGSEGKIEGNTQASNVTAEGTIIGNVHVSEGVNLIKGSLIEGDLTAKTIEIDRGALFNGRSTMVSEQNTKNSKGFRKNIENESEATAS